MIYCKKCGKELSDNAKFCDNCGTPTLLKDNSFSNRQNSFVGKVKKCPVCGEELSSFVAICPTCGHEMSSVEVSSYVKEFTKMLRDSDLDIAASSKKENKNGWQNWNKLTRIIWILLNIATCGLPAIFYYLSPVLGWNWFSSLTSEEKKKKSVIENYVFPNDKENIIEALLLVKSQIKSLVSGKITNNTIKWISIWKNKADQLYQKAEMMFNGDPIVHNAYEEITKNEKKAKRSITIKRSAFVVIVVLWAVLFFLIMHPFDFSEITLTKRDNTIPATNEETETNSEEGIYVYPINNYIGINAGTLGNTDKYGNGSIQLIYVTEDGFLLNKADKETKKQYVVTGQNIEPGSKIIMVHERDSKGNPYSNLVNYQSYDEILLYVSYINDDKYIPNYIVPSPTYDRHLYHIRDYVGRNAASFGTSYGNNRVDKYGNANININFSLKDGSYIDGNDIDTLKYYIVVDQDIPANSELSVYYTKNSKGEEYSNLVESQSYSSITLTLEKVSDSVSEKISNIITSNENEESEKYDENYEQRVELTVKYKVLENGKAEITGYSGDGNHLTIDRKIDGHEVVRIADSAFRDCTSLSSILFWADIESIGNYAFAGCTNLVSISVPNETKEIGEHAFEGCLSLSKATLWGDPNIRKYAFANCTSLKEISIGYNTEIVETHAFDGCTNLQKAKVWNDDTIIEKDAFVNCPKLTDRPIQE